VTDRGPVLRVDGARQLRASLKAAGVKLDDLKAAHLAVAQLVHRVAQPHAPAERPAGTQSSAIVRAGSAAVPYAGPIHWGWPKRHITAHPWIADAAASTEAAWLGQYMHALERVIDTIKGAE
jgi:hypothetical protein